MSRTISNGFRAALYARESDEVALALLTFTHAQLPQPLRLCTAPVERLSSDPPTYGVRSRRRRYLYAPIDVLLPEDVAGSDPKASLAIDNIDLELIEAIRSIEEGATVKLELILASAPDTVEIAFPSLKMVSAEYDRGRITVGLTIDPLVTEPYPGDSFTPSNFPGLT